MIKIDGSMGEGGGQILRTSLALSAITGKPFTVEKIRANRQKPGLMRQHLTGVEAVTQICNARVVGASLNSQSLEFIPSKILGGKFMFSIGTAGSTNLIFQTVLYPLLYADKPSTVVISGGTHNDMAPPFDFIQKSFLPILNTMGASVSLELVQAGFYPAGGGSIKITIDPAVRWKSISILERGKLLNEKIVGIICRLPETIIEREVKEIRKLSKKAFLAVEIIEFKSQSAGNLIMIQQENEYITNVFTGFGNIKLSAEKVAEMVFNEYSAFNKTEAPVGEYLADQLLLPMALAGKGEMIITERSLHFDTNIEVIQKFLDVKFKIEKLKTGGFHVKIN